jgi:excisionase family DNA binding protein
MRRLNLHLGKENMTTVSDELLTRKDLAHIFRVTEQTIVLWEKRRMFPALRLGTRVRYRRQDVDRFITKAQAAQGGV